MYPCIPLLSAETCQVDGIIDEFADIFEGFGNLPGKYHIQINEFVSQTQHYPRTILVAFKKKLRQHIPGLVKKKVLTPAITLTDRVSSMVVVKRPGKCRICLSLSDFNKAT